MKKLSLKAKCLCGNISFKTTGYHRDVQNCHCIQCLKTHGNFAAYTKVEEKELKFLIKKRWSGLNLLKEQREVFAIIVERVFFSKFWGLIKSVFLLVFLINPLNWKHLWIFLWKENQIIIKLLTNSQNIKSILKDLI